VEGFQVEILRLAHFAGLRMIMPGVRRVQIKRFAGQDKCPPRTLRPRSGQAAATKDAWVRTSADGQVHSWGVLGVGRFRGLRRCGVRQKWGEERTGPALNPL